MLALVCAPQLQTRKMIKVFNRLNFLLLLISNIVIVWFWFQAGIERELVSNTVDGPSAPIEEPIPTLSWPPEAFDNTSGEEDSLLSIGTASISMMNKSGKSVLNAFLLFTLLAFTHPVTCC